MKTYNKNGRVNPNLPVEDKFKLRTAKKGNCLLWTGSKTRAGYGIIMINGKMEYVHRYVYAKHNGEIPKKMVIRHTCDTPACVEQTHLLIGLQADNVRDAVERKRNPSGETHNFTKFSADIVKQIRDKYATGNYTQTALCKEYRMSGGNLNWIVKNKIWKRLT